MIAVLASLGVDLTVKVVFLGFGLCRKQWIKRRLGALPGAILLAAVEVQEQRPSASGEAKQLGDNPTVTRLKVDGATGEVATTAGDAEGVPGPFR